MMACCVNSARKGEMLMSSTLSPTLSEFSAATPATGPSVAPIDRVLEPKNDRFPSKRPSLRWRAPRALARFLITFGIGVAATLAWQSYGDAARQMIATSSPQLGWLAPQTAPVAQIAPDMISPGAPAAQQQLNALSIDVVGLRQSVDQLAAGQEQLTRSITKLQAAELDILDKISAPPPRPAGAPARAPVPPTTPTRPAR
jgi:hypothetical protein